MKRLLFFLLTLVMVSNAAYAQGGVSETEPALTITAQPVAISIAQKDQSVTLSCTATKGEGEITYQWFQNTDNKNTGGTAIPGATSADYTTEPFPDKEIRYYYCVATVDEESVTSDVAVVAYTGLPTLYINTVDGEEPTAEYAYPPTGAYGRGLKNATKVPSSMEIFNGDGVSVYNSGEYVNKTSGLTIKLRGNTSASLTGKSPYKLKLQAKADLLSPFLGRSGKDYADKEWILLKDGTTLKTFIGMTVCDIAGTPWTPEFTYVNVVINNNYRGVYMLIEAISKSKKRINVDKSGYIIERDAYWWNEDVKFITTKYNQKYTFKYPDDEDITEEQLSYIENFMNTLEEHVADGTYDDYLDVESFARWLLVHDIVGTWDAGGSNMYMSKYDNTDNTKVYMSTNWDFDTMYRQVETWANQHNGARIYAKYLFESSNRNFINSYQAQWDALKDIIWSSLSVELQNLKENIGEGLNISRKCDAIRWKTNYSTVEAQITEAQKWYTSRTEWLNDALTGTHTLAYELNGGTFAAGAVYPTSYDFDDVIKLTNPTKTGYVFSGWKYATVTSPQKNLTFYGCKYFSDITFAANWKKSLTNTDIVIAGIKDQTYTGSVFTPEIVVKDGSKTLVVNTDYTISLPDGRINTGDYLVTITGKGNYAGTITKQFSITPAVVTSGALTITTDQNGTTAVIDGDCGKPLAISTPFTANTVTYKRSFKGNTTSTVMLPFEVSTKDISGSFYTMKSITPDESNVWTIDTDDAPSTLSANTPYLFNPSADITEMVFENVEFLATEDGSTTFGDKDEWAFQGVYTLKEWKQRTPTDYGFAANKSTNNDGQEIEAGQFVRAGANSKMKPTRAYLTYDNSKTLSKSATSLPEKIIVLFPDETEDEEIVIPVAENDDIFAQTAENDDFLTPISEVAPNAGVKVWSYEKTIFIEAREGMEYSIVDMGGRRMMQTTTKSDREEIHLNGNPNGIMIVRIAGQNFKVMY